MSELRFLNGVSLNSGQTRHGSPLTEGISYHLLASSLSLLPPTPSSFSSLLTRATTENHALDSFQNLLFSIARFREVTQRYPERITVVGYEMKRRRFENLHLAFVRWPSGDGGERWRYIGINPKFEGSEEQMAYEGEVRIYPLLFSRYLLLIVSSSVQECV